VSSGPPDWACVVHNWTDELLVEEHAVLNGKTAPAVKEGAKHAQSLSRLSPYLVDVRRPGQPCIKGYPKVPCCVLRSEWSLLEVYSTTGVLVGRMVGANGGDNQKVFEESTGKSTS
jgi:hypothetical protein